MVNVIEYWTYVDTLKQRHGSRRHIPFIELFVDLTVYCPQMFGCLFRPHFHAVHGSFQPYRFMPDQHANSLILA